MSDELRNPDGGETYDMYDVRESDWSTPVRNSSKFPNVAALKLWDQMMDGNGDDTCGNASDGPWSATVFRSGLAILTVYESGRVEAERYADSIMLDLAWTQTQDNAHRDCEDEECGCSEE